MKTSLSYNTILRVLKVLDEGDHLACVGNMNSRIEVRQP